MAVERKPTVGRRVQALLFGTVPGLAHILVLDRTGAGTAFFLLFVLGADAALAGRYLLDSERAADVYTAGCVLAGAAWLGSWIDMTRLAIFRDYEKRAAQCRQWAAEGVRLYAAGQIQKAGAAFRRSIAYNHQDPDALFWLGCVQARLGRVRRARRAFRRCIKYDLDRKWAFEIAQQEIRLGEPRSLEVSDTGSFHEVGVTDTGSFILPPGAVEKDGDGGG